VQYFLTAQKMHTTIDGVMSVNGTLSVVVPKNRCLAVSLAGIAAFIFFIFLFPIYQKSESQCRTFFPILLLLLSRVIQTWLCPSTKLKIAAFIFFIFLHSSIPRNF